MVTLKFFVAALLASRAIAVSAQIDRWTAEINTASVRFGLPAQWIRQVMRAESGGRTFANGRLIVSRTGAMGLMQLMPDNWAQMRMMLGLGSDPFEPRDNILAGAAYLRMMYHRFGYPGLFAAYNAGPGRYSDHLVHGTGLPSETLYYLAKTTGNHEAARGKRERARSFALFADKSHSGEAAPPQTTSNGLFVIINRPAN